MDQRNQCQEMRMAKALCPVCGEDIAFAEKEGLLFWIIRCPCCSERLQVIHEVPLTLKVFRVQGLELANHDSS